MSMLEKANCGSRQERGCKAYMSTYPPSPQMHQTALVFQPATEFLSPKNLRRKEILLARRLCAFQEEKVKEHLVCSEDAFVITMFSLKATLQFFRSTPEALTELLFCPHSGKLLSLSRMKCSASKNNSNKQGQDKIEWRPYDLSQRQRVRLWKV